MTIQNSYNPYTSTEDAKAQKYQSSSSVEVKDPDEDSTTLATTNIASWAFALINTLGGESATNCNNAKMEAIESQKDYLKEVMDNATEQMNELKDQIGQCSSDDVSEINRLNGLITETSTNANNAQTEGSILVQGAANSLGSSMKEQQANSDGVAKLANRMMNKATLLKGK